MWLLGFYSLGFFFSLFLFDACLVLIKFLFLNVWLYPANLFQRASPFSYFWKMDFLHSPLSASLSVILFPSDRVSFVCCT